MFLKGWTNWTTGQYWIGGTDRDKEGAWRWTDGRPWNYTNWPPGEPSRLNVIRQEDCVSVFLKDGTWNDNVCEPYVDNLESVCSQPLCSGTYFLYSLLCF